MHAARYNIAIFKGIEGRNLGKELVHPKRKSTFGVFQCSMISSVDSEAYERMKLMLKHLCVRDRDSGVLPV